MSLDGAYHKHLDVCRRCANNPFDLCPIGALALAKEFKEATKDVPGFEHLSPRGQDGQGK